MKDFGLHLFGKSIVESIFSEMMNPYAHAMAVARCAQSAEILIKARVAQEHPLLIFQSLPKARSCNGFLSVNTLLHEGRSFMYADLPELLWASTGHRISDIDTYNKFGRLRNTITHLGVPDLDLADEAVIFGFLVVEPLVRMFWGEDVISYMENYDCECFEYLQETLERLEIDFSRLER
ncbi:hypothetical protein [Luteimonas fraxinea]|uniref:Apea-like HEPN domain-containing protein n=1 Tax=Luteimonas fraxinea TaxID=2901869 RepID=A0ABS8UBC9_9GAMM|nr:hypothetical protein [Luteimonas fraxinea]MCD9096803.1 hypothetical protein [Luteimonas fraxinea]